VAAGDFATDGDIPKYLSYLDKYKNYIVDHATDRDVHKKPKYNLPQGFHPEYFAYHPWQDINTYLKGLGNHRTPPTVRTG
jgi:hypothetical protein